MGIVFSSGDRFIDDVDDPFFFKFVSHVNKIHLLALLIQVDLMIEPGILALDVANDENAVKTFFPEFKVIMGHYLLSHPL